MSVWLGSARCVPASQMRPVSTQLHPPLSLFSVLYPRSRAGSPLLGPGSRWRRLASSSLSIPIRSGLISMSVVTADCGGRARSLRQSPRPAPPGPSTVRGFSYCHQLHCTVVYTCVQCCTVQLRRRSPQPSPPQLPNTDQTLAHLKKQMKWRKIRIFPSRFTENYAPQNDCIDWLKQPYFLSIST